MILPNLASFPSLYKSSMVLKTRNNFEGLRYAFHSGRQGSLSSNQGVPFLNVDVHRLKDVSRYHLKFHYRPERKSGCISNELVCQ